MLPELGSLTTLPLSATSPGNSNAQNVADAGAFTTALQAVTPVQAQPVVPVAAQPANDDSATSEFVIPFSTPNEGEASRLAPEFGEEFAATFAPETAALLALSSGRLLRFDAPHLFNGVTEATPQSAPNSASTVLPSLLQIEAQVSSVVPIEASTTTSIGDPLRGPGFERSPSILPSLVDTAVFSQPRFPGSGNDRTTSLDGQFQSGQLVADSRLSSIPLPQLPSLAAVEAAALGASPLPNPSSKAVRQLPVTVPTAVTTAASLPELPSLQISLPSPSTPRFETATSQPGQRLATGLSTAPNLASTVPASVTNGSTTSSQSPGALAVDVSVGATTAPPTAASAIQIPASAAPLKPTESSDSELITHADEPVIAAQQVPKTAVTTSDRSTVTVGSIATESRPDSVKTTVSTPSSEQRARPAVEAVPPAATSPVESESNQPQLNNPLPAARANSSPSLDLDPQSHVTPSDNQAEVSAAVPVPVPSSLKQSQSVVTTASGTSDVDEHVESSPMLKDATSAVPQPSARPKLSEAAFRQQVKQSAPSQPQAPTAQVASSSTSSSPFSNATQARDSNVAPQQPGGPVHDEPSSETETPEDQSASALTAPRASGVPTVLANAATSPESSSRDASVARPAPATEIATVTDATVSDAVVDPSLTESPATSPSTSADSATSFVQMFAAQDARPSLASQQVAQALHMAGQQSDHLRVLLTPPELGEMTVDLVRTETGIVARLEFSNAAGHQAVQQALPELQQSLLQSGIRIDRIELHLIETQRQPERASEAPPRDAPQGEQADSQQRQQRQQRSQQQRREPPQPADEDDEQQAA